MLINERWPGVWNAKGGPVSARSAGVQRRGAVRLPRPLAGFERCMPSGGQQGRAGIFSEPGTPTTNVRAGPGTSATIVPGPGAEPASPRRRGRPGATGQPGDGHAGREPAACGLARPAVSYPWLVRLHLSGQISPRSWASPASPRRCGAYRALTAGSASSGLTRPTGLSYPVAELYTRALAGRPDVAAPGPLRAPRPRPGMARDNGSDGPRWVPVTLRVTLRGEVCPAGYPKACV
jgi:hypothetical protein